MADIYFQCLLAHEQIRALLMIKWLTWKSFIYLKHSLYIFLVVSNYVSAELEGMSECIL